MCRLRVALIRNGIGILVLLSIVTYCFMNYVVEPFGLRISLSCYVEAVVPKIVEQVVDFEIIFRCDVKRILTRLD